MKTMQEKYNKIKELKASIDATPAREPNAIERLFKTKYYNDWLFLEKEKHYVYKEFKLLTDMILGEPKPIRTSTAKSDGWRGDGRPKVSAAEQNLKGYANKKRRGRASAREISLIMNMADKGLSVSKIAKDTNRSEEFIERTLKKNGYKIVEE